ncbi:MAG: YhdT family protein [Lachnospiraceae bacterium]|nr:YhdT family protein [Lachnospiraceae bacterium]
MEKRTIDPMSRDYDFSEIEPDPRFVQTGKEFWITLGVYGVYMVLMIGNLFLVNGDPAEYTYIMGFPLWIFLQICILVGMVVSVLVVTSFVYQDMDITPHGQIRPRK